MSRRLFTCWLLAVYACGLLFAAGAESLKMSFPQEDLAFVAPAGWQSLPPPEHALALVRNPLEKDKRFGTKGAVLLVVGIPPGVKLDQQEFVARTRKSIEADQGVIVRTGEVVVNSLTYATTIIAESALARPRTYMCTTFANDRAVTLMLNSLESDASQDPELDSILRSLHFLSPLRPVAELTLVLKIQLIAQRHAVLLATLGLLALAAGVVLILLRRKRRSLP